MVEWNNIEEENRLVYQVAYKDKDTDKDVIIKLIENNARDKKTKFLRVIIVFFKFKF